MKNPFVPIAIGRAGFFVDYYGVAFGRAVRCIFYGAATPPQKDAASIPNAYEQRKHFSQRNRIIFNLAEIQQSKQWLFKNTFRESF